jgi:hypothetical protein
MVKTTTKSIWAKNGQVIAPDTRLDVLPYPGNGWRFVILIDDRGALVKISEGDIESSTAPAL